MPDNTRAPQEQLDQILPVVDTQSPPYVELSDKAITTIVGGLDLKATQALHQVNGDNDTDVPDCLIWDIDTPN